jgi:hypothetical protein
LATRSIKIIGNSIAKLQAPAFHAHAAEPIEQPPPSPLPTTSRSGCVIRFPRRYEDFLPAGPTSLAHIPTAQDEDEGTGSPSQRSTSNGPVHPLETCPNDMGVFRHYPTWPTLNPDENINLSSLCDGSGLAPPTPSMPSADPSPSSGVQSVSSITPATGNEIWSPFSNFSQALLMAWHC